MQEAVYMYIIIYICLRVIISVSRELKQLSKVDSGVMIRLITEAEERLTGKLKEGTCTSKPEVEEK